MTVLREQNTRRTHAHVRARRGLQAGGCSGRGRGPPARLTCFSSLLGRRPEGLEGLPKVPSTTSATASPSRAPEPVSKPYPACQQIHAQANLPRGRALRHLTACISHGNRVTAPGHPRVPSRNSDRGVVIHAVTPRGDRLARAVWNRRLGRPSPSRSLEPRTYPSTPVTVPGA